MQVHNDPAALSLPPPYEPYRRNLSSVEASAVSFTTTLSAEYLFPIEIPTAAVS